MVHQLQALTCLQGPGGTMKLLWAPVVVVCIVSSSVGFTIPEKDDFHIKTGLKDLQRYRTLPKLLKYLAKATLEYGKIVEFIIADWSAAIPDAIDYMRRPLMDTWKLVEAKQKPYTSELIRLANSTGSNVSNRSARQK
ncbi:hypothetical protein GE061_018253 [Apolygus lucorum]|uniref:Uncharacterized protein n=1 Tax=Apolygus lucorum TaxID=248454 RepID=A0A8S9XHE5_APOLU|nr:hypothetical protein GE061_018253 [Apolygus lucorum]